MTAEGDFRIMSSSLTLPGDLQRRGPVPACIIEGDFIKIPLLVFKRRVEVQFEVCTLAESLYNSEQSKATIHMCRTHEI